MYAVSAPAKSCDSQSDIGPDNANLPHSQKDLMSAGDLCSGAEPSNEIRAIEGSELAAKILQLHAASQEIETAYHKARSGNRRPRLVEQPEDAELDMPGVFNRPLRRNHFERQKETVPRRFREAAIATIRGGPSFRTLVLGTAMLVLCGGVAVAVSLSGLLTGTDDGSRPVETRLIKTEPTIESLIDASSTELAGAKKEPLQPAVAQLGGVSAQKIANAKDRIRKAFALRGISTSHESGQFQSHLSQDNTTEDKIQARLEAPLSGSRAALKHRAADTPPALAYAGSTDKRIDLRLSGSVRGDTAAKTGASKTGNETPAIVTDMVNAPGKSQPVAPAALPSETSNYPYTGKVLASVNFRQDADKDASVLGIIQAGTEVRFDQCGTWWCGVIHDGQTGFIGQKFLERADAPD